MPDALNQGVLNKTGNPVHLPHHIYIDNDIYLDVTNKVCFEQAIAVSIEAFFILLGTSDL